MPKNMNHIVASVVFALACPAFAQAEVKPLDQVGAVVSGFKLLRSEAVTELDSRARLFEHERSGAKLLYLSNSDDNRVFCITFRTPPSDDTGIAHILEHSVFCGSERFPVKDPFAELLKGSLQTFLNAFTANDRTYYPVASRNEVDFRNLIDVYLDAVFHPRLLTTPEIMMQEGWHYEVDDKGNLSYNGIVYNEMKGALSAPRRLLAQTIEQSLFPKGTYHHNSGGDPAAIPSLTQKKLAAFHQRYYHPSNACVFVYGNGDAARDLAFLDSRCFSQFERRAIDAQVVRQPAFAAPVEKTAEYSIDDREDERDKTFLSVSYMVGSMPDADAYFGMDLLAYMLLDSQAAPLRRALLEADAAKDVESVWEGGLAQPYLSVIAKNSNPATLPKFLATVDGALRELAQRGLDKRLIEAAINRKEFQLRENDAPRMPQGLTIGMHAIDSWIYGGDPLLYLRWEAALRRIKEQAAHGYFEKLIRERLLANKHRAVVVLKPKRGLDREQAAKLRQHLAEIRQGLSAAELAQVKAEQAKLQARQKAPDAAADLAKLPCLTLADLRREVEPLPLARHAISGAVVLHHPESTKGVVYLNLYFDAAPIPPELTPYASLLAEALTKVDTAKRNYRDLASAIDAQTGGISIDLAAIADADKPGVFHPRMAVSGKALLPKAPQLLDLLQETLLSSRLDDRARLKEIVQESRIQLEEELLEQGHKAAYVRAAAHALPAYAYRDAVGGIAYYRFLAALEQDFDARAADLSQKLRVVADLVIRCAGLTAGVTLPERDLAGIRDPLAGFFVRFPAAAAPAAKRPFAVSAVNEAITIPSKVQYVAQAADYRAAHGVYSGQMLVLAKALSSGYLYDQVRVLRGAYGAGMGAGRDGALYFWSFRDPHVRSTLDTFHAVPKFLAQLELPERERVKAIIAAIGRLDEPLRPSQKGELAVRNFIARISDADRQRERDEVLATTAADLRALGALIGKSLAQNHLCVLGGEEKLREERKLFQSFSGLAK